MKSENLKKALEKAGIKINKGRVFYRAQGHNYTIQWVEQGDIADCVYVLTNGDKDDIGRDYFAGHFVKTIKSAIEWALK